MIESGEAVRCAVAETGGEWLSQRLPERQSAINSRTARILIAAASHLLHKCNNREKSVNVIVPFLPCLTPLLHLLLICFSLQSPLSPVLAYIRTRS